MLSPRLAASLALKLLLTVSAMGQWMMLRAPTDASLRGIHNVGSGIAWASGAEGTVLRTIDEGKTWSRCAVPPEAAHLDFRAVQGLSASTALVMSSGPGQQSRIYRTSDGCKSWTLTFENPDGESGFFDCMVVLSGGLGIVVGDPIRGSFALFRTRNGGEQWQRLEWNDGAAKGEALFAASNSAMLLSGNAPVFVTGGTVSRFHGIRDAVRLPLRQGNASAGAFSVAIHGRVLVAVGGDYQRPEEAERTAARSLDSGHHWELSRIPPRGYRSAVQYDSDLRRWVCVGPTGTDVSNDNGETWTALQSSPGQAAADDQGWNALSLPFVVGSKGRIGRLKIPQ